MDINLNDPRVKKAAMILGLIMLLVGIVWFFMENGKYNSYQPVEAHVTATYFHPSRRGSSASSTAYVTYTVDGKEYKSSVNLHCGERALKDYENTDVQIYYNPDNPHKAVSKQDRMHFPAGQVIIALTGLALAVLGLLLRPDRQ